MSDNNLTMETEDAATEKYVGILSREDNDKIVAFLESEFTAAEMERSGEEEEWKTIRRQRWARPEFEKKNVPWPDASNVCPPGAMIATNTVFGMTKNAFGTKKPFWSITALQEKNHEDAETAKIIEKYMQILADSPFDLNKRERDREIQEETDSLGTSFLKIVWTTEKHHVVLEGGKEADAIFHDGPEWIVFPREDALYRLRTKNLQKARWFAQKIELEEQDVEERFASGKWTEWKDWRDDARTEALEHERDADEMTGGIPLQRNVWDFYEVSLKWDLAPKDGFWEELILIFHRKSKTVCMAAVNPIGIRTIREFNFIRRTFRLDGTGVGHAAMHMQAELEALHNNRINAVHMTTLKMFVARKNSGVKARESMSPGKIFLIDNVADFKVLETGEVYSSSLQAEANAWQYLQKATLVPDSMSGFADQTLKSRDGLGMQANRMRAASGIVASILEGMEDAYSDAGLYTFLQLVWNKATVMENETRIKRLTDDELHLLDRALSIEVQDIPVKLRFSVRTSDVEQTFEARRQNALTLWSIYMTYSKQVIPMLMQVYGGIPTAPGQPPQQLPQPVKEALLRTVVGSGKLMEKLLEFFGEDETGDYVPPHKLEELAFRMMDMAQEQALRRITRGQEEGPQARGPGTGPEPPAGSTGNAGLEGALQAGAGNPGAGNGGAQDGEGAAGPFPGAGGFTGF